MSKDNHVEPIGVAKIVEKSNFKEIKRDSNIELLRVISIIMIVISHYCVHGIGGVYISSMNFGINRIILECLTVGNMGTILFVLISGYFLINSNKVKLKKIVRLIAQVQFYTFFIYLVLLILKLQIFNIKDFIKILFPISFKEYWFATCYLLLYFFHPYINKLLNSLNRNEHIRFNCSLLLIFSILRTFTPNDYFGNELIQFLMFYSIGAYLSKYPNNFFGKNNNNKKIMILSLLIIILSIVIMDYVGIYINVFNSHSRFLLARTSPLAILFCVSMFDFFARKKEFYNDKINKIGSLVFGVYLLSSNRFLAPIIWNTIFQNEKFIYSSYLIFHIIVTVITTVFVCLIVEYIRKILENSIFKVLDDKFDVIDEKMNNIFKKMD